MKKLFLYVSLVCIGLASCSKDFFVSEEGLPEWLGESIYEELKNPKTLDGTFNTYLRLIDDLGYAEVLSKTGSKTIFPANDAAFEGFFKNGNNKFGKSRYEDLTEAEKAQLLYSSMLDNAILVGTLSNNEDMLQGQLVKHPTNISLLQSVEPLYSQNMPSNNKFFDYWKNQGKSINALYDNTAAPMVHFTWEYLLNNNITVSGADNDFYVLTGQEYEEGSVYIFDRKVTKSNVTCQNGYIHQLDSVLVNPGNMAQILRSGSNTRYISRMLDYFCAPFKVDDQTQANYFEYMKNYGPQDSVYAIRYFSKNSQRAKLNQFPGTAPKNDQALLTFDPGWNNYNPTLAAGSSTDQDEIAAILVPTDDVVEDYFLHDGSYIVENLGVPGLANTKENLTEHLDAIYNTDPTVFASFMNNIMQPYLTKTVPSKFSTVQNDAFEFMNVTRDDISRKSDGKFDVTVANNGVIYRMSKFFAPEVYNSVLGPASVYTDMRVMGEMLRDHQTVAGTPSTLGADMYYYLLSMKSKYAVFIPEDNEEFFYVDPASIYDTDGIKALRFYYGPETSVSKGFHVLVQRYRYNSESQAFEIDANVGPVNIGEGYYNTQLQDMLNYHTVVLENTSGLNGNNYYKTKHGGAIYVPDGTASHDNSSTVMGALQIGSNALPAAVVKERFYENSPKANITNGTVYKLDRPIQPTINNVYTILNSVPEFEPFMQFCAEFDNDELLTFAGILTEDDSQAQKDTKRKAYVVFGERDNVNMFGSYNYTLYVPTDMEEAYANGLPRWDVIKGIGEDWTQYQDEFGFTSEEDAKKYVKEKIDIMHNFVLYHMQNNSVFADKMVTTAEYQTFCTDNLGIAKKVKLSGGGGELTVTDVCNRPVRVTHKNVLARDVKIEASETPGKDINGTTFSYNKISSSAFVTIHGIEKPLCYNSTYKY